METNSDGSRGRLGSAVRKVGRDFLTPKKHGATVVLFQVMADESVGCVCCCLFHLLFFFLSHHREDVVVG